MTDSKYTDPEAGGAAESSAPPAGSTPKEARSSGRVAFDARGNPIWEWQLETGVYSRDVNTQKLRKLNLGDLSIAESAIQKQPPGLGGLDGSPGKAAAPLPGGGFNPYDSSKGSGPSADPFDKARALAERNTAPAAKPVKSPAPAVHKPAPPPRKESLLTRLDQWFQAKRGPKSNDDDYE